MVLGIPALRYWFWCSEQQDIINLTMGCDIPYDRRRIPLAERLGIAETKEEEEE